MVFTCARALLAKLLAELLTPETVAIKATGSMVCVSMLTSDHVYSCFNLLFLVRMTEQHSFDHNVQDVI